MSKPDIEFHFLGENIASPVAEGNTAMIVAVPPGAYDDGALIVSTAKAVFQRLNSHAAEQMGETLHHATWTITADPQKVVTRGSGDGCPHCLQGIKVAVAYLESNADREVAVGEFWWTA